MYDLEQPEHGRRRSDAEAAVRKRQVAAQLHTSHGQAIRLSAELQRGMRASAGDGKPLRVQMQRVAVRVTQTERVTLGPGAPEQGLRDVQRAVLRRGAQRDGAAVVRKRIPALTVIEGQQIGPSDLRQRLAQGCAHGLRLGDAALAANDGKEYDISICCVNIESCEMSAILPVRDDGIVYFFSMATSFTKAALGAEGIGKDVTMIIGNGYTKDHAEITLNVLRENEKLRKLFDEKYC